MFKSKFRAQVSVFIIIALIMVVLGVFLLTKSNDNLVFFQDETSAFKIRDYVQTCMKFVTQDGVKVLGEKGGILYSNKNGFFASRSSADILVKSAIGVDLFGEKNYYWYYFDDARERFVYNIPSFDDSDDEFSVENQLERYVLENLEDKCLRRFVQYKDDYDIVYDPDSIEVDVEFKRGKIYEKVNLDIQINEIGTNASEFVNSFAIEQDNKLEVPYYLARDIVLTEKNSSFIESKVLNFLVHYEDTSSRDLLPPRREFTTKADFKPWQVRDIEKLVKQILEENIGVIKFAKTLNGDRDVEINPELRSSKFASNFYSKYRINYFEDVSKTKEENPKLFKRFSEYNVVPTFYSTLFPMSFKIPSSLGNILVMPKTQSFLNGLIPIFFTEYSTVYEMTFPVEFKITGENKYDDFVFNIFVEANIKYNKPLAKVSNFEGIEFTPSNSNGGSLICNPSQFRSDFISLNISDPVNFGKRKLTSEPIAGVDGAQVYFDCKGISTCFIGNTKVNGKRYNDNVSMLRFRAPLNCNPSTLIIRKLGYKTLKFENLNPTLDVPIDLGEKFMPSGKELDVKIRLLNPNVGMGSMGRVLNDDEVGFVIFTDLEDEENVLVLEFDKQKSIQGLTLNLIPSRYSVQGFVINEKEFTIPKECVEVPSSNTLGAFLGDTDCEWIDEMKFKSWVSGGVELEEFEVDLTDVMFNDEITIKLVDLGVPTSFEELKVIGDALSNLKDYSYKPKFSSN